MVGFLDRTESQRDALSHCKNNCFFVVFLFFQKLIEKSVSLWPSSSHFDFIYCFISRGMTRLKARLKMGNFGGVELRSVS